MKSVMNCSFAILQVEAKGQRQTDSGTKRESVEFASNAAVDALTLDGSATAVAAGRVLSAMLQRRSHDVSCSANRRRRRSLL